MFTGNNRERLQAYTNMALSLLFAIFSFAALAWGSPSEEVAGVPAIFVFGDSLADVGNNNYLNTVSLAKADFLPNGIDFPGRTPTGRFSNGFNTIDWLAKLAGYNQSPPAFLSLKNGGQPIVSGVSFASGGSGILDTTGINVLTFTAQIADFKSTVDDLKKQMGEERASYLLSRSLFLITAGSNDMFEYYLTHGPQNSTQNKNFVATLVDKFSDHLKILHTYGARKFAVMGISHIGCIPFITSQDPTGKCNEDLNGLAITFNAAAKAKMQNLMSTLEGMKYSYGNVYDLMSQAIANPGMFGYKEIRSACCGSGNFNGASPCTLNATLCSNRDQYLFWDWFHPTQAASKSTAMNLYGGSQRFATPINIKLLAMS